MDELTLRQREVLDLIKAHIRVYFTAPTVTEIADGMGFKSPNAASAHIAALEKKGVINVRRGVSRGITLTESTKRADMVPVTLPALIDTDGLSGTELDCAKFHNNAIAMCSMAIRQAGYPSECSPMFYPTDKQGG
ncbi:LexA family protein [Yersinia enterocolitica]